MIRSQKELKEVQQPGVERLSQTEKLLLRYEALREWVLHNQRVVRQYSRHIALNDDGFNREMDNRRPCNGNLYHH